MSSDVYVDFSTLDGQEVTVRIGHLGLLISYGYNLVEQLRYLQRYTYGLVLPATPFEAENLLKKYLSVMKEDLHKDDAWWLTSYGYHKPEKIEDVPKLKELEDMFKSHIGQFWRIRVD